MFPYLEIMFQNDELAWEISDFLELEENEIKRFRKKKIPKKVITKMEKQKAQMRVEERDKRFEELQNQMMAAPQEIELETEEVIEEEPLIEPEEITEEVVEEPIPEEIEETTLEKEPEDKEEKPKKKTDKQVSLFSF